METTAGHEEIKRLTTIGCAPPSGVMAHGTVTIEQQ